ncbi:MAG: glycoside hydrolase family 25 protein [Bacteroidaceae bacterium]|nr:glycoside hydrolase family 25 protein [Bacteroidaceae bacterium]
MAETRKTTTRKKAGTSVSAKSPSASARKKKTTTTKKKTAGRPRKKRKSGGDLFSDFFSMKNISKQTEKTFRKMLSMLVGIIFCFILAVGGAIFLCVKYVNPYAFKLRPVERHLTGYSVYGIDVSRYQGDINWDRLAAADIDGHEVKFVIVKATEGADHSDSHFERNFTQAKKNGFVRGAYHFFTPGTVPYFQIQNFIRTVGNLEEGDLPPILDIEKSGGISKKQLQEDVLKWLVEIERVYKVRPIIYTGLKFKRQYLDRSEFDEYPLWIANYADSLSYDGEWELWQYSQDGKVDGISDYVDLDVYHTTLESFESLLIHK